MDSVTIIRIVAGCLFLCVFAIEIIFLASLSGVLSKCSPQSRKMQPGLVWLCLIPFLNLVWVFFVVSAISDSLGNEFRLRGASLTDPKPAFGVGLGWAISGICSFVPGVIFVHLIFWIVYWVKISGFKKQLNLPPVPFTMPSNPAL